MPGGTAPCRQASRAVKPAWPRMTAPSAVGYAIRAGLAPSPLRLPSPRRLCSISLGATARFEYLPAAAPSARRRCVVQNEQPPVKVDLECGDVLLLQGGLLPHRIVGCTREPPPFFAGISAGTALCRVNIQVRLWGHDPSLSLGSLLEDGFQDERSERISAEGPAGS